MVFTSFAFVAFFGVVMAGLAVLPNNRARQLLILAASCYFYSYWNPRYLLLLAAPSVIDYLLAIRIEDTTDARARKRWVVISLATNLGLLAYFKYTNFFIDNVAALLGLEPRHLDIVLPVGISFFTFKTLSYTIDVYRKELPACRSILTYAMFVTYFPELIAGPIVRASVFLPQITRSLRPSWARARIGLQVVLLGVTKKLVFADRFAVFVDPVFRSPQSFSSATIAAAVVAYSIQIYCDFSGYSDIAIGVSQIIGFDLPENFNMPYISTSITEFWRRWHITLSSWLRDYLYIPLGGNRKGKLRTYVNLMITMLLGGLWHGASWNFVIWGLLHGIALAVHKVWLGWRGQQHPRRGSVIAWVGTYVFVCIAWVFFRAHTLGDTWIILKKLCWVDSAGISWVYSPLFLLLPLFIGAHVIGVLAARQHAASPNDDHVPAPAPLERLYQEAGERFAMRPHKAAGLYVLLPLPGFVGGFLLTLWLLFVYLFASLDTGAFIYFQF